MATLLAFEFVPPNTGPGLMRSRPPTLLGDSHGGYLLEIAVDHRAKFSASNLTVSRVHPRIPGRIGASRCRFLSHRCAQGRAQRRPTACPHLAATCTGTSIPRAAAS